VQELMYDVTERCRLNTMHVNRCCELHAAGKSLKNGETLVKHGGFLACGARLLITSND
jgi:hypothetical protein